jgi:ABC-2 type transport system ATP-binding protein
MIEIKNLTKRFGEITAINDLTFSVKKGEVLGFLGPNGAGKTTTMRILTCFMPATSGTATISGFDIFDHPGEVKKRIGYLPENPPLYNDMTIIEYLRFVAEIKGIERRKIRPALVRALERCSLGDVASRLIGNLSRGYKQRVGLAQAIIHNPDFLILDEPTVGLDPKQIIEMRRLIKDLAGEQTIILSTHILPEVTAACNRVIIINEGRIVAVDSPEGLSTKIRRSDKIGIRLSASPPDLHDKLEAIEGVLNVIREETGDGHYYIIEGSLDHDIRSELARCAVLNNWGLLEMKRHSMSLEDIFLKLTTKEDAESTEGPVEEV